MTSVQSITVSQLNSYVKVLLDSDQNLNNLYVSGEISNFKRHYSSGHLYFSLKDEKSVVKAVMFSGDACRLKFDVYDGMKVIVRGKISSYEPSGQYQIYVYDIFPQGIGELYTAFEQLKSKLYNEGLFDESLKKPIPKFPKKIGVITSKTGAVIHDIKNVSSRRYPLCEIVLYPVEVQGEKASGQIVKAIKYFNESSDVDTLILGRGGGSLEELWAFNKEEVARAVFDSRIPIISAVGHETDVTICDLVADKRASTPSVAAEMATPDRFALSMELNNLKGRITKSFDIKCKQEFYNLMVLRDRFKKISVNNTINTVSENLKKLNNNLNDSFQKYLKEQCLRYEVLKKRLKACSNESVLKKGYAMILSEGSYIKSINSLKDNSEIEIVLQDGSITCKLTDIKRS